MRAGDITTGERFDSLWGAIRGVEGGLVEAIVVEVAPKGSLRPEVRHIRAAGDAGRVLVVSNVEAVFCPTDPGVAERLRLLESLATLTPATT